MSIRATTLLLPLFLGISCAAQAQQATRQEAQAPPVAEPTAGIDDVVVVNGFRYPIQLRMQMLDAELRVYDLFNQYNDNPQFELECGRRNIRGTRLQTQDCVPVYERQAFAMEAQDNAAFNQEYLNMLHATGPFTPAYFSAGGANMEQYENYAPSVTAPPADAIIRRQQPRLQEKMREIAAAHPEFVEALESYVDVKARYAQATKRVDD